MEESNKFGDIIKRERKSKKMSLKDLEVFISKDEEHSITASYLSRLENGSNSINPTIKLTCQITKMLGLDFKEVLNSFGYGDLIGTTSEYESVDSLIRSNNINAPSQMSGEYVVSEKLLTDKEKETFIRLTDLIFAFTLAEETNTIQILRDILDQIDVLRKNRQKTIIL